MSLIMPVCCVGTFIAGWKVGSVSCKAVENIYEYNKCKNFGTTFCTTLASVVRDESGYDVSPRRFHVLQSADCATNDDHMKMIAFSVATTVVVALLGSAALLYIAPPVVSLALLVGSLAAVVLRSLSRPYRLVQDCQVIASSDRQNLPVEDYPRRLSQSRTYTAFPYPWSCQPRLDFGTYTNYDHGGPPNPSSPLAFWASMDGMGCAYS